MGPQEAPGEDRLALEGIRAAASAPAKCILLGEHAVVYGEPCLSLALARRTRVAAHRVGDRFRVNGYALTRRHHGFIMAALNQVWGKEDPVRFEVESQVPSASGIGSSAALTVATVAALRRLQSRWALEDIAQQAFEAERSAQGGGSPNDTSVATAGGSVFLSPEESREEGLSPLWGIASDAKKWFVHRAPAPRFGSQVKWVVGHTGVHAVTRRQVEKAGRFVSKSGFGKETVRALGRLSWQGLDALREQDPQRFGKIMDEAHSHLVTLGVSHPSLERLVGTARRTPGTLGAKLTGAGGGGAMLVLSEQPEEAAKALQAVGAKTFTLRPTEQGVQPEPETASNEETAHAGLEPTGNRTLGGGGP